MGAGSEVPVHGTFPGEHPVDAIARRLHDLLRVGLRPAHLVPFLDILDLLEGNFEQLPVASANRERDPYVRVESLASLIEDAVLAQGDGVHALAGRQLFGLTVESRARPLKDRRRLAANEIDKAVSTWRRYYENDILHDLAYAVWRRREVHIEVDS